MATQLTPYTTLGPYPATPLTALSADATPVNSDVTGNYWQVNKGDILIAWNSAGTSATLTIASQVDVANRKGDITAYAIGAGFIAVFGPFDVTGWADANGRVNVTPSAVTLKLAVLRPKTA